MSAYVIKFTPKHLASVPAFLFRDLRIGLESYRAWLLDELNEINETVATAMSIATGSNVMDLDAVTTMAIPLPLVDNKVTICQLDIDSFIRGFSGEVDSVVLNAMGMGNAVVESIEQPWEAIQAAISNKILDLQGSIALIDASLQSGLNTQFNATQVMTALEARGWQVSTYVTDAISLMSGGANWVDCIKMMFSSTTAATDQGDYAYTFDKSDFSESSGTALALNSIATDIASFFSTIDLRLDKVGQFIEQVFNAITNMFVYMIRMLIPDVACDYQVMESYVMEAIDIPFAHITFDLNNYGSYGQQNSLDRVITNAIVKAQEMYDQGVIDYNHAQQMSPIVFAGSATSGSGAPITHAVRTGFIPNHAHLKAVMQSLIKVGECRIMPAGFGFYVMSRISDSVFDVYFFYGTYIYKDQISNRAEVSYLQSGDEFTITTVAPDANHASPLRVIELPGQGAFSSDFVQTIVATINNSDRWNRTYFGGPIRALLNPSTPTGNTPSHLLEAWSNGLNAVGDLYNFLFASVLCAALTTRTSVGDEGNVVWKACVTRISTGSGSPTEHVQFNLHASSTTGSHHGSFGYYPYVDNSPVSCQVHCQTDAERTAEMKTLLGRLAKVALAIGVTAAAIKVRRKMRVASLQNQVDRRIATDNIMNKIHLGGSVTYDDWKTLRKFDKVQKRLDIFGSVSLGTGAFNSIQEALSPINSIDESSASDSSRLIYMISGK